MGPIAFLLVFLALPIGTAIFLITYTAATLAWRGMAGAPVAAWALVAVAVGALAGLVIGRRLSRGCSA
ncbi:MAG: hypothetical protein ACRDZ7_16045 [Acidimicrobiia bacterium]